MMMKKSQVLRELLETFLEHGTDTSDFELLEAAFEMYLHELSMEKYQNHGEVASC